MISRGGAGGKGVSARVLNTNNIIYREVEVAGDALLVAARHFAGGKLACHSCTPYFGCFVSGHTRTALCLKFLFYLSLA